MHLGPFRRVFAAGVTLAMVTTLLAGAGPLAPRRAYAAAATTGTFTFAHVTDAHVGSSGGNANLPKVVDQLLASPTRPDFIIDGGDATEFGMSYQYDSYQQITKPLSDAGIPAYHIPGNHDARWSDAGKQDFTSRFGPTYSSFDRGGVHFVLLDTAVNAETHGHIDKTELTWLAADLAKVGISTPVMVFSHHPIGYTASRFLDNDQDFLDIVKPYNIVALFSGHGHLNLQWNVNGISAFMTAAAMDAGFKLIQVGGGEAKVYNQVAGGEPQLVATLPLARAASRPAVTISAPANGAVFNSPTAKKISVQYSLSGFDAVTAPKVQTRLDVGGWQDYTPTIDLTGLPPGFHSLYVQAIDANGNRAVSRVQFQLTGYLRAPTAPTGGSTSGAGSAGGSTASGTAATGTAASSSGPLFNSVPALRWRFQTGGGIQGQPALDGTRVFVGSTDGNMYALRADSGQLVWSFHTGGAIVSGPVLDSGRLYFGSADKKVYALDAATGRLVWSHATGGAVVAPALVEAGTVYIGSADHNLYALNASTGVELWHFAAGDTIRTAPVFGRGAIYFGAWDRTVYAVNVATGALRWKNVIARDIYYSPANGSPAYGFGRLYLTTPNDAHAGSVGLWALNPADGSVLWQSTESTGFSSPQLRGDSVLAGTLNGTAITFDPFTGAETGTAASGWSTYDSTPVDFGKGADVVFGTLGGRLDAVNPGTGQTLWTFALGDNLIFSTPAVGPGAVSSTLTAYIGSLDGSVYAVSAVPSSAAPQPTFRDATGHWAQPDIDALAAAHLSNGVAPGVFGVELPLRRGELVALVARLLGLSRPSDGFKSNFSDLDGHWAQPYIQALEEKGLLTDFAGVPASPTPGTTAPGTTAPPTGTATPPTGTTPGTATTTPPPGIPFRPQDPATRGDAAVLIAAALRLMAPSAGFQSKLTDLSTYPHRSVVQALEEQGLVTGYVSGGKTIYAPGGTLTRAQGAALIARMLRY